ncbi:MAG: transposase [Chitinophagales bacterium]
MTEDFRDRLHKYLFVILRNDGSYPLAVGEWLDPVHIFFELPVTLAIPDHLQRIKSQASLWVNENKFIKVKFQWQSG